jgi:hypothetical protein
MTHKPQRKLWQPPGMYSDWTTAILLCLIILACEAMVVLFIIGLITFLS